MKNLSALLDRLATAIPQLDARNVAVSAVPVGWHIEHTLLVINRIADTLQASDPAQYRYTWRWPRLLVFALGKIPRGRAQAPPVVLPGTYDAASLRAHVACTQATLARLPTLGADCYFTHPYFGDLRLQSTGRFLEIHTRHHLAIIRDIVA